MCSHIYKDSKGTVTFGSQIVAQLTTGFDQGTLAGFVSANADYDPIKFNARVEHIYPFDPKSGLCGEKAQWYGKPIQWVQTFDKIQSFIEAGKRIVMCDAFDVAAFVIDGNLRIVTRPDGISYKKMYNCLPPFVTERMAEIENQIHPRFPLYCHRVA